MEALAEKPSWKSEDALELCVVILALAGIAVSGLALGEHYGPVADAREVLRTNQIWNSAYVNQSPYAEVHGIHLAVLGIVVYAALAALALLRRTTAMVYASGIALAYALYLTKIEADILHVWCAYYVSSLILITLISFLAFASLIFSRDAS